MNAYTQLKERQQNEVDDFPLGFAFSNAQFDEMMRKWGLEPTDTDKIYSIGVNGGFVRKSDSAAMNEMFRRHTREHKEAIESDSTGEGYIKDMFASELADHEYGYTYELDDTLNDLGLTLNEVKADKRLRNGLNAALKKYYNYKYEI